MHVRPRGRREQVLLLAARRRGAAVVPLQRDGALQRRGATGCRSPQVPWSCTARWRMPVDGVEARDRRLLPRRRLGAPADRDARRARRAQGRSAAHHSFDDTRAGAAGDDADARRARRHAAVGGPRSSTPTRRARRRTRRRRRSGSSTRRPTRRAARTTFDRVADAVHRRGGRPTRSRPTVHFLRGRRASAGRRAGVDAGPAAEAGADVRLRRRARAASRMASERLRRACMRVTVARAQHDRGRRRAWTAHGGAARARCCPPTSSRARRRRALHVADRPARARRDRGDDVRSVNTFPVLATPADDAVLGAAIMLPDHPQIAPESRGEPVRLDRDRGGAAAARARARATASATRSPTPTRRCGR